MVEKEPLYEDNQFKIDFNPNDTEGHILELKVLGEASHSYILQRGILQDMAQADRGTGLVRIINLVDDRILYSLQKGNINLDSLHVAILKAYYEEVGQATGIY